MIELNQALCQELDLTYWQLNSLDEKEQVQKAQISREEKDLLRKILLAKAITVVENQLEIKTGGEVIVNLKSYRLIFNNVKLADSKNTINLSKISKMLNSTEEKKLTWLKLKDLNLS